MSCGSCHCSPCSCDEVCDPNNEPLASALNNFIASFYGSISKTCVDNQVQWILPCDLNTGLAGFERRQGEGTACYLLRLFEYLVSLQGGIIISDEGVIIADPATQIDFVGSGVSATAADGVVTVTIDPSCAGFYNKIAINGECYDTWQAAYDANVGATTPTLMLVGQGSTFGNLVLSANYNSNIIPVGFGIPVSQLGTISGAGFTVNITAHQITVGAITSSGAVISLGGQDVVYGAVSTINAAGNGGDITVSNGVITGDLSTNGSVLGGTVIVGENCTIGAIDVSGGTNDSGEVTLGRQSTATSITANGRDGDFIRLGDECIVGPINSLATVNSTSPVIIGDDCVVGDINISTVAVGVGSNDIICGDRCEIGNISASGSGGGGGNVTIGKHCECGSITNTDLTSSNGGAIVIGDRTKINGAINCTGFNNGGAVTIGSNAQVTGAIVATGTNGGSGPIVIQSGGTFTSLTCGGATSAGDITIGKFSTLGAIASSASGPVGTTTIGDGTTINGGITRTGIGVGLITIGNSVTITAAITAGANSGNSGGAIIGRGCNLQDINLFTNGGNGGNVVVGAATVCGLIYAHTGGGVGRTSGSITLGSGVVATILYAGSPVAGASSGNVILEPGASCSSINVASVSGTGGSVTLKNSNVITGDAGAAITMGSSNVGNIISINSKIADQIDNVNGTSLFRDLIGSTPAGNRDFIANLTASGSQYTNCLIVPHGTGVSIQAAAPRTVIAYQFLQKNAFPANVTLSEGSETTSANLLAP